MNVKDEDSPSAWSSGFTPPSTNPKEAEDAFSGRAGSASSYAMPRQKSNRPLPSSEISQSAVRPAVADAEKMDASSNGPFEENRTSRFSGLDNSWALPPLPQQEHPHSSEAVKPIEPVDTTPESDANADRGTFRVQQDVAVTESVADRDALDRSRLAKALAKVLLFRKEAQPMTLALFGPWGAGKSSLIRFLVDELLSGDGSPSGSDVSPHFRIAEFNAWQNERVDNIGAALAQAVVEALTKDLSFFEQLKLSLRLSQRRNARLRKALTADVNSPQGRLSVWISTYAVPFAWPLVMLVIAAASIPLVSDGVGKLGAAIMSIGASAWAWKAAHAEVYKHLLNWFKDLAKDHKLSLQLLPSYMDKLGSFHEMSRTLEDLCVLAMAASPTSGRQENLLLLVDDLDRCSPASIKQVFDAVRLVACIPNVVVLVALDHRIAYAAVAKHYADFGFNDREVGQVARDYLSKVFNLSVVLPAPDGDSIRQFIMSRLFELDASTSPAEGNGDETALAPMASQETAEEDLGTSSSIEAATFVSLASSFGFSNPRELWRLKQTWSLLKGLALNVKERDEDIIKLMTHLFLREAICQASAQQRALAEKAFSAAGKLSSGIGSAPQEAVLLELWTPALMDAWPVIASGFAQRDITVCAVLLPAAPVALIAASNQ